MPLYLNTGLRPDTGLFLEASPSSRTPISTSAPLYSPGTSYFPVPTDRTPLTAPVPTNAWYENWLVGTGQQPINVFPYMLKVDNLGLNICVPNLNTSSPNAVLATMLQNFSFRATTTSSQQKLTAFTDLGCTLTWNNGMSCDVVRGSAYVTMRYTATVPVINSQNAIVAVNGTAVGATGTFSGLKFKFALNNGQTWLLYTSSSVTLTLSTANTLTASGTFTGTMRLALLPSPADETVLDTSSSVIPTGGIADYSVSGNTATETYAFTTTTVGSAPAAGRVYPLHTNIISTTFWVGELFNPVAADGSQVCSTYDSQWAKRWSGKDNGSVAGSGTDCAGAPLGGCDGVPSGSGSSFQCATEVRTAANNYFPTHPSVTPLENPFYLDLPFDDLNDNTGYSTRATAIPWANDPGFSGNATNQNFSYMKNRWVKIMKGGRTCYAQIQDAGPGQYHDTTYVFGSTNARPASTAFNNAGMDVSPAVNGYLQYASLDGQNDAVSWQFVDAVDVPQGPWTQVVTTSQVDGATPTTAYRNAITPPSSAPTGSGQLLMYAMQHHLPWLQSPSYPGATIPTLRGQMKAVLGSTWTLSIPLPTVSWNNVNPIASNRVSAITTALATDKNFVPTVSDPYFGGKQLAKAARLALIADQLGDTTSRNLLLNNLKPVINAYLTGASLRYDTAWGGIVSTPGLSNQDADFGNGRYNDHHFHYGYAIYAVAVIAKYDSAWGVAYTQRINDLVRDIMNPSTADPYFTPMRNWDWFEGHSWAAGNFEFGDNRNLESTSEAVNAWYGVYLWGSQIGNTQIRDLARVLLAQELVTAQKYWQIKQADTIYPAPFKNNGVVGILWSNKVDYATWFGGQAEYIHGIQMIPINPVSELLIPDAWIAETWPAILNPLWTRTSVWRAELINGGSGYVPAQFSPTGQGYSDGLVASGGTGSGLGFNVNITAGQIIGVYIIFNQHGNGYTDGETITLNGSGGTGAQVRVYTEPEDGWKGILLGALSHIDPDLAWTRTMELAGFDDGSSKTQALVHIASQTAAPSNSLSGTASSTTSTTANINVLTSNKSLAGTARSTTTTTAALGQAKALAGSAISLSRTTLNLTQSAPNTLQGIAISRTSTLAAVRFTVMSLQVGPVIAHTRTSFLFDDDIDIPDIPVPPQPIPGHHEATQFLRALILSGPGHFHLTTEQIMDIYARYVLGETFKALAIEYGLPQSVMQRVMNRLPIKPQELS